MGCTRGVHGQEVSYGTGVLLSSLMHLHVRCVCLNFLSVFLFAMERLLTCRQLRLVTNDEDLFYLTLSAAPSNLLLSIFGKIVCGAV